jgi:hypothetical protein
MSLTTDRYTETDTSVFFKKTGFVFHRSFARKYYGKNVISARQVAQKWHTRSQQDEIIHYLKDKQIIK